MTESRLVGLVASGIGSLLKIFGIPGLIVIILVPYVIRGFKSIEGIIVWNRDRLRFNYNM